ncbi:MAG: hypothetical protein ACRESV_02230, partial [Nevskiales bacterium]
ALNGTWRHWQGGGRKLAYQRIVLDPLADNTVVPVQLLKNDGRVLASATTTTLPKQLGNPSSPFIVFLGSCFWVKNDAAGHVGRTYSRLPAAARPHIKILCGDQVYLDAPWQKFFQHTHGPEELARMHFQRYLETWTQDPQGFASLLAVGANYFCSDDHEFWNNAPDRATLVLDTWYPLFRNSRKDWWRIACELYRAFQTEVPGTQSLRVGTLSFFIAETRFYRENDQRSFMRPTDLAALSAWISQLQGPGVVVIGQPVFAKESGVVGQFTDWSLPDYRQYPELMRVLARARHTLVLLTGDVHHGRLASCHLATGEKLVEVISSPLALVDKNAGLKWEPAPERLAVNGIPAFAGRPIETDRGLQTYADQFTTLEFSAWGASVRMKMRVWPIDKTNTGVSPLFERDILLGD